MPRSSYGGYCMCAQQHTTSLYYRETTLLKSKHMTCFRSCSRSLFAHSIRWVSNDGQPQRRQQLQNRLRCAWECTLRMHEKCVFHQWTLMLIRLLAVWMWISMGAVWCSCSLDSCLQNKLDQIQWFSNCIPFYICIYHFWCATIIYVLAHFGIVRIAWIGVKCL